MSGADRRAGYAADGLARLSAGGALLMRQVLVTANVLVAGADDEADWEA